MLPYLMNYLSMFLGSDDEGQTMVEYGLLLALIAVVVIVAILVLGPAVAGIFENVTGNLAGGE